MIEFDETICRSLEEGLRREWLETNGLGGFASSTITALNTRRYHGLLVAAMKPPLGRMVLLSKLEETLVVEGRRYELGANRYPGVVHPNGYQYLKRFRLDPYPVFVYQVEDCELEKIVFMVQGENTTVIQYAIRSSPNRLLTLELRPLIAFRGYHNTTRENGALDPTLDIQPAFVQIKPYRELPPLYFSHTAAEVRQANEWYRNFEYERERERGLAFQEDLFNPCILTFDLSRHASAAVLASTEKHDVSSVPVYREAELQRRRAMGRQVQLDDPFVRALASAASQFLVRRGGYTTVIAGYHWFGDWGRDTMIALPGLTLSTGQPEAARSILTAFAAHVDRGMLPNRFPDSGEAPEYNSVDASLWFFEAARALVANTGDYEFVRTHLYAVLADMISWHERGTRHGIHVDADGLLMAGEPGVQLTWMDARVGDRVVTPRHGKAVEIQALWYNALRTMAEFAAACGKAADLLHFAALADQARGSFCDLFWNQREGCLFDLVDGAARDSSIRPNQIFAVSLHHRILTADRAKRIVQVVERELLTPYGLRTLSPADPKYRGRFDGDPASRDSAYHQGTVWPWLLGPFIHAYVRVHDRSPGSLARAVQWIEPLKNFLEDRGVGQLPEVFDGDAPHHPGGCIAQAWSVAEMLRACAEDIYGAGRLELHTGRMTALEPTPPRRSP
jgi:predicted glycogen debranching enzyme